MSHGVSFPARPDGRRSTTALGREVVATALRAADPVGALGAEQETAWRSQYVAHFRRLVEAGLATPEAWCAIADAGLGAIHERMVVAHEGGADLPLSSLTHAEPVRRLDTDVVAGEAKPVEQLEIPYRGRRLRGAELSDQLGEWTDRGVLEPSAAAAVLEVAEHPEWLRLEGRTPVVLGAGAEMGPLGPLLGWGATVAAVDLPRPAVWERVVATARASAGRLLVPVPTGEPGDPGKVAGVDLLAEVPEAAEWLRGLDGRLVLGNYLYADGGTHVRVSVAADALATRLVADRPDTGLAFLATPTDVFAVPHEAVAQSTRAYAERSGMAKLAGRPLRWATRGRLLHRAYPPEADPGIADALVPVQGPSYALAKRVQRWRATAARRDGRLVSFHVAPSTRTRSVVKNRALAAAFAGAHRFGVEVFEPDTANTLMAALLVRDVAGGTTAHAHPWQDEAHAAVHGGLWRAAYAPPSALGLAAVLGYASARG
ncbi:hypothetical protein EXE57_17110 [Nocardioides euryhalodurans]|uniref:Uncharacterized protein n=2 Tax=Nocardioides euryhalodurans TaxID=2518370 RepID=A0A4P7GQJ6_9ACTN|nr:hypothetical protein EXE57_17110 [Nocardioides euryhalodurans]